MTHTDAQSQRAASTQLDAWHRIIIVCFTVLGLAYASMLVRMPLVRDMLGVTTAQLGVLLFVGAVGSLLALSIAGRVISARGTRPAIIWGSTVIYLAMIGEALAIGAHSPVGFGIALFIAGFAIGFTGVGINVDGSAIEIQRGRSVLPRMHAAYSIGTLAGAAIGTVATLLDIDLVAQMIVLSVASLILPVLARRVLPHGNGSTTAVSADDTTSGSRATAAGPVWRSLTVVGLGLGIFGLTLAEGASNDWLTLAIVDDYRESETMAGVAYVILLLSITVTRYFGGQLVDRFGRVRVLQVLSSGAILGLFIIIVSPFVYVAFIGVALWGAGVALAFPLFISAAGEHPNSARTVAFVTSCGYGAFLVGPPLLGFLGQAWGLLNMYWVIMIGVAIAALAARAARSRTTV